MCLAKIADDMARAEAFVALNRHHSPGQELAIRKRLIEARARHEENRRRQYEKIEEEMWG